MLEPADDATGTAGANGATVLQRTLTRLGLHTEIQRDIALAVGLGVLVLIRLLFALLASNGEPLTLDSVLIANAVALADVTVVAFRRRAPRTALLTAVALALVAAALPTVYPGTGVAVVICTYTVASLLLGRDAAWLLTACAAAHFTGGVLISRHGGHVEDVLTFWGNDGSSIRNLAIATIASVGIPALIGSYIQTRRAYTAELADKVVRLERDRAEQSRAVVRAERSRIARELHDVAAHDLSAIVVQAGAADRLLEKDPDAARSTLRAIRAQGRETLVALRELVGIMRTDDGTADDGTGNPGADPEDSAARSARPSMVRLDDLLNQVRALGMRIELTRTTIDDLLPVVVDLAAYRVVQESLTNASLHAAGARVRVDVAQSDRELEVTITNDAPPTKRSAVTGGGGHGLLGMTERVALARGELRSGPTDDGGWQVRARFPLVGRERT